MATVYEIEQQQRNALNHAEMILTSAEAGNRRLTRNQAAAVNASLAEHRALAAFTKPRTGTKRALSQDYVRDFAAYISTGGSKMGATMSEGQDTLGGFAVPSVVAGSVVQLAPEDGAIRNLATIVNTDKEVYFPVQTATGIAAVKPETGGAVNLFTFSTPTLARFPLSAFTVGTAQVVSTELFEDSATYMAFLEQDMGTDVETCEEHLYLHGTGYGQPQGILGNVGPGVTQGPDAAGNLVTADAILDVLPTLKSRYHNNATWLMNRATGLGIRKALRDVSGDPMAWTRSGGQDFLHGWPVAYSAEMPDAAPGACPVVFGDFEMGYLLGQRGGPAIRLIVAPQATDPDTNSAYVLSGRCLLIAFRRVDGRVRRSEALQQITCAAS